MPGTTSHRKSVRRNRNSRNSRNCRQRRLSAPAVVAAVLLGLVATAVVGVSASADPRGSGGGVGGVRESAAAATSDPLGTELATQVRAVSDPHSPQYRHFRTSAQVAKYLAAGTSATPNPRAATGGSMGDLMRSQRVDVGDVLDAADSAGGDAKADGAAGPPRPCSEYFGQLRADVYPTAFGIHPPFAVCGYTPAQLRSAYDTDAATGRGVTVAVLDAYGSPTVLADANEYATRHGDPPFLPGQYTEKVDPAAWTLQNVCGGSGSWSAEQTLDVEAVHALAPGANILYYGANSCQDSDLLAALTDVVAHHLADVVTASWGGPVKTSGGGMSVDVMRRYDRLFQVAALEGITVDFSAGDCGVNAPTSKCGGESGVGSTEPQTSFPASDPWVTAVGGTSIEVGHDGSIRRLTAWGTRAWKLETDNVDDNADRVRVNENANVNAGGSVNASVNAYVPGPAWKPLGWIYGGGGGASADFAEPWYQVDRVPAALATTLLTGAHAATPRRTVPDIALDADPFTGMLVGQTRQIGSSESKSGGMSSGGSTEKSAYVELAAGGTSLASPLLAALEADAIQLRGGLPLGFANPTLYALARTSLFADVEAVPTHLPPASQIYPPIPGKPAVLARLGDDSPLMAAPGYDTATGLGAPSDDFAEKLAET